MINNLFDKKTAEYEFLSVSTELPFKASDVKLGNDVVYGTPNNAQSINDIFNHLVDNDLYNEQLILNLKENRNVVGAAITGDKERILKYSHDGQKFVLTSNVEPEVRIVKRIVSDANSYVLSVEELKGRRINFILDESQQYVVGTDRGLYCSEDRLSGYHLVTEFDYFKESFENFDCKCCIRNYNQGSFHNELDNYQYFLGTNSGVFGLDNSDYFNDTVFWNKLPGIGIASPLSNVNVNCLKLDPVEKVLFVGTDNAIYKVYGNGQNDLNVSEEWYSNQFKTNDIELLKSQILRNKNEHILVGSKTGIKQSTNKFFPNDVSLLSTFQERITAFGVDSSLKYVGTNKHLYSISPNNEYVPIYLSGDGIEFEVQDIEITNPADSLTCNFVVAGNDVWYKSNEDFEWKKFLPSELSNKKISEITVIDDRILLIVDTSANAYWCQFIIDGFHIFSPLTREGTGTIVYDVGDNENNTGFVGTDKGADVYKFSEGTDSYKAYFKLRNNLKTEKITNLFEVNDHFIVVQDSKIWISQDPTKDFSSKTQIPKNGKLLKVDFKDSYYYIVTSSGTFRTEDFQTYEEIKLNDEIISSLIFVNNYVVFSTSSNKAYCILNSDFSPSMLSAYDLFSSEKALDFFNTGISNTFDTLDMTLEDQNTISQYLLTELEIPNFDFSLCTNFPLEKNRLSNSGLLLTSEKSDIPENSFLSSFLSSFNISKAFVSISEDDSSSNKGQNFIGFIEKNSSNENNFYHLNSEQYFNNEYDYLTKTGYGDFEYSSVKDVKYLLNDLFLSKTNELEIYGIRPNVNSIVLYDRSIISAIPYQENTRYYRKSIMQMTPFASINNIYASDSNVLIDNSENFKTGAIGFVFSNNTLSILKVGYQEEPITSFYTSNKNYYGTDFNSTIGPTDPETGSYSQSDNGKNAGNDGEYNFLENSLSGFNSVTLYSGKIFNRENLKEFNVYTSNNGIFFTKQIDTNYGSFFNGLSNILTGNINCIDYDSETVYVGTDDHFILTANDFFGDYLEVNSPLTNCKELIELSCNGDNVSLVDSINTDISVEYPRISPIFLGSSDVNGEKKLFVSTGDFLNYYRYNNGTSKFEKNTELTSFTEVKIIKKIDDGSAYIVFSNDNLVKFSDFGFEDANTISSISESLILPAGVGTIENLEVFPSGILIRNSSNEVWMKLNDSSSSFEKDDKLLSRIVVMNPENDVFKVFGSYGNSIFILNSSGKFTKIFESQSSSPLIDVYKIKSDDDDIFNNVYLFAHQDGSLFMVVEGIDSGKFVSVGNNITGKVCIALDSSKENLLIVAISGNQFKAYQTKSAIYDNSPATLLSTLTLPNPSVKDVCIHTINGEPSILVMFECLLDDHLGNISVKRYRYAYNYSENKFSIEECIDNDEDEGPTSKFMISCVNIPEEWTDLEINSFVDHYEDINTPGLQNEIFVSTNKGLAYLKNDGTSSYSLIKVRFKKSANISDITNGSYLESGQNIYFGKGTVFKKIDKDSFEISSTTLNSNISKVLGAYGNNYYFADSSKYPLSSNILNWDSSPKVLNGMDFINYVPMNAMLASNNPIFGSSNTGLYAIQEYSPMSSDISYNILSDFNIDCIEFSNDDPIFSMHLICLDLEFDYISSTIDDLTEERLNRVLAIDKISDHEIVILDKDSIRIYDTQISQMIDLDLIKFNSILGGTTVFEMSPIGIDSNGNAYLAVNGSSLFKFNSWTKERVFGNCKGDYKFLNSRFGQNSYVNQIYMVEDDDFFVGVRPPESRNSEDIIPERRKYSFHSIRDLRMDIALNNENGEMISGDSRAIGDVVSDISHGYATKYLFSSGNILYNTFNKIVAEVEVDKIPNDRIITTIFTENDAKYMIGTTNGLYLTNPEFALDDEMRRNTVDSVTALMADALQVEIRKHLAGSHYGNSMESKFLSVLNSKMSVKPDKIPEWFTSSSKPLAYNSITYISNDIVESMEFNDSNKYVRGSVKNWITDLYGGDSTYSDPGYVDLMTDPIDGSKIDFSDVPYVCKNWNSGLKEFMIYVPTTMTYYINNPKGFSNSIYSDASFPRKNAKNFSTSNIISEKYTSYQLVLDNKHYKISRILLVQINGNSLPLRMYRDDTYCQAGRENLFDTVIQPSEVNSLPIVTNESVNNVSYMADSSGYLRINFSIYGTDAQSIRILAE